MDMDEPRRSSLQDVELLDEAGGDIHDRRPTGTSGGFLSSISPRSWKIISGVSVAMCLVLFVALIAVAGKGKGKGNSHDEPGAGGTIIDKIGDVNALEDYLTYPRAEGAKEHLKYYTAKNHIAGSPRDYETAVYTKKKMLEYGIPKVDIVPYEVLLSYPLSRSVSVSSPIQYTAEMKEPGVAADPTSALPDNTPTFHGYSASGDATGALIYANYGRDEDFAKLKAAGIDLTGAVVIVRYGKIFRGNKVGLAEAAGASAVLIYSDPADDGGDQGAVFPDGPWRPPKGVQRGSVFDGEGDPLTPGWAAVPGCYRKTIDEARDPSKTLPGFALPRIPSQPLSWFDAQPMLKAMSGKPVADIDPSWQGGLNFTYHIGVTAAQAGNTSVPVVTRVNNQMNFTVTPIWNVVATIEGLVEPDRAVVIGNHRDAWVLGAVDPSSGSAVLMEIAYGLGSLLGQGWRPRRSIILTSWDAEEYGLVGSVEWVERRQERLAMSAVAYLNADTAVQGMGPIKVRATPQLAHLAYDVAHLVPQPLAKKEGETLYQYWLESTQNHTAGATEPRVPGLGAGSDFAAFLQFAGVSSMDFRFQGDPEYYEGVYHSNYDSFYWMEQFGDPTFKFHQALAQYLGGVAIRLAEDVVLPFNHTAYAEGLKTYLAEMKSANTGLDLTRIEAAVAKFKTAAIALDAAKAAITDQTSALKVRAINDRQMQVERAFLVREGLPGRPWFKHAVFSPSLYNSYGSEKFPGVYDALAVNNVALAKDQVAQVARSIDAAADVMAGYVWDN